jgi:ABC-type nitrate/sulfonate/bicarbonate transport system substrate-binding protein
MGTRKRTTGLAVAALVGGLSLTGCGSAGGSERAEGDCSNFKVAVADDDARRTALYAIEHDKVDTSQFPDLELSYLAFPALIQATGTKQFDVIESSLIGIPLARSKGVDLKIVALSSGRTGEGETPGGTYVLEDSDISTPDDLAGKKVGVTSFGSSTTMVTRILLDEAYGMDSALTGGDITWVEMDPAQLTTSLERGQIDAVADTGLTAFRLGQDPQFRRVLSNDAEWRELTGQASVFAAYQALESQVASNTTCYEQFQDMLAASVEYGRSHIDDVAASVADETGLPADYVTFQWDGAYDYVGNLDPEWLAAGQTLWDQAAAHGEIQESLNIEDEIVK